VINYKDDNNFQRIKCHLNYGSYLNNILFVINYFHFFSHFLVIISDLTKKSTYTIPCGRNSIVTVENYL